MTFFSKPSHPPKPSRSTAAQPRLAYTNTIHLSLFTLCWGLSLIAVDSAGAYPTDPQAQERTGIPRLDWQFKADHGLTRGRKTPVGARLPAESIHLHMLEHAQFDVNEHTPIDASLQAGLIKILKQPRFRRYNVALLDITDPSHPRYAAIREHEQQTPGSTAKALVGLGMLNQVAQHFGDDIEAREHYLKTHTLTADHWAMPNSHEIPIIVGTEEKPRAWYRSVKVGDTFSVWAWLDHMLSPSSNAAATTTWKEAIRLWLENQSTSETPKRAQFKTEHCTLNDAHDTDNANDTNTNNAEDTRSSPASTQPQSSALCLPHQKLVQAYAPFARQDASKAENPSTPQEQSHSVIAHARSFEPMFKPNVLAQHTQEHTAWTMEEITKEAMTAGMRSVIHHPLQVAGLHSKDFNVNLFFTRGGNRYARSDTSRASPYGLLRFLLRMEQGRLTDAWTSLELKKLLYLTRRRTRYGQGHKLKDSAVYFKTGSLWGCDKEQRAIARAQRDAGDEDIYVCGPYQGDTINVLNGYAVVETFAEGAMQAYVDAMQAFMNETQSNETNPQKTTHQAEQNQVKQQQDANHIGSPSSIKNTAMPQPPKPTHVYLVAVMSNELRRSASWDHGQLANAIHDLILSTSPHQSTDDMTPQAAEKQE